MRILVTGGTGLIGSAFIASRPDDSFVVLTRKTHPSFRHRSVETIHNLEQISTLDGIDAVVNLCGEPIIGRRWNDHSKALMKSSRIAVTKQLVSLINRTVKPPALFLSGSAIGVYSNTGSAEISESDEIEPHPGDFAQQLCLEWELEARQVPEQVRSVQLRTGIVLAREGGALAKMLPAFKLGVGGKLGSGQQFMSWIHLEDQVAAMNHLIDCSELSGPVNIVAPKAVTNSQFTTTLARTLSRPAQCTVPACALKLMLGEASQLLLDSQKVIPSRLMADGYSFHYPDLESALSGLLLNSDSIKS